MKTVCGVLIATIAALPLPARAQKLDLTTTKCAQLQQMSKEQVASVTTWLAGYYTQEGEGDVIDLEKIKETADKITEFCTKNASFSVSGAAEGILSR
jgi:hypothetical protein